MWRQNCSEPQSKWSRHKFSQWVANRVKTTNQDATTLRGVYIMNLSCFRSILSKFWIQCSIYYSFVPFYTTQWHDTLFSQKMFLIFIYITLLSKGKIIKKVNKQLVGMITKCFQEGKEMQIVVIYGVVRNDMNWDVSLWNSNKVKYMSTFIHFNAVSMV